MTGHEQTENGSTGKMSAGEFSGLFPVFAPKLGTSALLEISAHLGGASPALSLLMKKPLFVFDAVENGLHEWEKTGGSLEKTAFNALARTGVETIFPETLAAMYLPMSANLGLIGLEFASKIKLPGHLREMPNPHNGWFDARGVDMGKDPGASLKLLEKGISPGEVEVMSKAFSDGEAFRNNLLVLSQLTIGPYEAAKDVLSSVADCLTVDSLHKGLTSAADFFAHPFESGLKEAGVSEKPASPDFPERGPSSMGDPAEKVSILDGKNPEEQKNKIDSALLLTSAQNPYRFFMLANGIAPFQAPQGESPAPEVELTARNATDIISEIENTEKIIRELARGENLPSPKFNYSNGPSGKNRDEGGGLSGFVMVSGTSVAGGIAYTVSFDTEALLGTILSVAPKAVPLVAITALAGRQAYNQFNYYSADESGKLELWKKEFSEVDKGALCGVVDWMLHNAWRAGELKIFNNAENAAYEIEVRLNKQLEDEKSIIVRQRILAEIDLVRSAEKIEDKKERAKLQAKITSEIEVLKQYEAEFQKAFDLTKKAIETDSPEARGLVSELERRFSGFPSTHRLKAAYYEKQGMPLSAFTALSEADKRFDELQKDHFSRGNLDAAEHFETLREETLNQMIWMSTEKETRDSPHARRALEKTAKDVVKGDFRTLKDNDTLRAWASIQIKEGNPVDAALALEELHKRGDSRAAEQVVACYQYAKQKGISDIENREKTFIAKVVEKDPNSVFRFQLAEICFKEGDFVGAKKHYEHLIESGNDAFSKVQGADKAEIKRSVYDNLVACAKKLENPEAVEKVLKKGASDQDIGSEMAKKHTQYRELHHLPDVEMKMEFLAATVIAREAGEDVPKEVVSGLKYFDALETGMFHREPKAPETFDEYQERVESGEKIDAADEELQSKLEVFNQESDPQLEGRVAQNKNGTVVTEVHLKTTQAQEEKMKGALAERSDPALVKPEYRAEVEKAQTAQEERLKTGLAGHVKVDLVKPEYQSEVMAAQARERRLREVQAASVLQARPVSNGNHQNNFGPMFEGVERRRPPAQGPKRDPDMSDIFSRM